MQHDPSITSYVNSTPLACLSASRHIEKFPHSSDNSFPSSVRQGKVEVGADGSIVTGGSEVVTGGARQSDKEEGERKERCSR